MAPPPQTATRRSTASGCRAPRHQTTRTAPPPRTFPQVRRACPTPPPSRGAAVAAQRHTRGVHAARCVCGSVGNGKTPPRRRWPVATHRWPWRWRRPPPAASRPRLCPRARASRRAATKARRGAPAGERAPRVRRRCQRRRRVWPTAAASPPPFPTGSGRNGGHGRPWCARTSRPRGRRWWSHPHAARRHGQGTYIRRGPPAQLPALLRGGACPCTHRRRSILGAPRLLSCPDGTPVKKLFVPRRSRPSHPSRPTRRFSVERSQTQKLVLFSPRPRLALGRSLLIPLQTVLAPPSALARSRASQPARAAALARSLWAGCPPPLCPTPRLPPADCSGPGGPALIPLASPCPLRQPPQAHPPG